MSANLDIALADQYFREAKAMFERDGGALWGQSLEGALIVVDYETRLAATNQADALGMLVPQGRVWVGSIPPEVTLANTALTWAGVEWTMVLWQSLSEDLQWRLELIAHESFHRVQAGLGFPMPSIPNANTHLDTFEGRYWLQLEWRALEKALESDSEACRQSMADALYFRLARRAIFPQAALEEKSLEMHEGLAEYTGFRLSQFNSQEVAAYLRGAPERYPSFVRSFAYASGPAYGYLLDELKPGWRSGLAPEHDLAELLGAAAGIWLADDLGQQAEQRAQVYAGENLRMSELARDQDRQAQIRAYRERLLERPALILPISEKVQCAFDPRTTIPIPSIGTVFSSIRVSDSWGILEVQEGGLLMSLDWKTARICAPDNLSRDELKGKGWKLQLAEGWLNQAAGRLGDLELVYSPS